jgi:DNA-binding NtrC family response regulator
MESANNRPWEPIAGTSSWAIQTRATIAYLATSQRNVLISGPHGSGKHHIARLIHDGSPRRRRPLVVIDCGAFSGRGLITHLFGNLCPGHTFAANRTTDCFAEADGGTILFEEVHRMAVRVQERLLRALVHGVATPRGNSGTAIDVRFIASTTHDLVRATATGRFLPELYQRLCAVEIKSASLADRPEDIEVLSCLFLNHFAREHGLEEKRLSPEGVRQLLLYNWPGNVNELEMVLERAVLAAKGETIGRQAVQLALGAAAMPQSLPRAGATVLALYPGDTAEASVEWPTLEQVDREHLRRTLEIVQGNAWAAARLLQLDWLQMQERMRRYGLRVAGHAAKQSLQLPRSRVDRRAA